MPRRLRSAYKPRSIRKLEKKARNRFILSVIIIIIFFYALVSWGLPLIIGGLSEISKTARPAIVQKITEDPAIAPPVLNIPFEATSSPELIITGYSSPNTRVEIYLDDEIKTTTSVKEDGSFITDPITLLLGTNNIYGKAISDSKKSLPSKTIKLNFSNEKPTLDLSEPQDGTQVKGGDKKIHVSGKTDPSNSVTVNGATLIVNNQGNFSTDISLNDGDNTITIITQNQVGNTSKLERKITYVPQ